MVIKDLLTSLAREYPEELVEIQLNDVARVAFHIGLVLDRQGADVSVVDIGGGIGLFSAGCAAAGMKTTLIDDFQDEVNTRLGESVFEIHRAHGVEVISRDVVEDSLELASQSIDVVTSFDSMEHWHHSPKRLFRSLTRALKPGGLFILGTPNCVNLRKRITVPLGYGKWTAMQDWYERERFRGHVREPDVADLIYIAKDIGLKDVEIVGRNWRGYSHAKRMIRLATVGLDHLLRLRPSLCSDLYMIGRTEESERPVKVSHSASRRAMRKRSSRRSSSS